MVSGGLVSVTLFSTTKYRRDALPHASYRVIGTPIELTDKNTPAVFGDYLDVYDMTQAVQDGTTVKIYYESRIARLELSEAERPDIDNEYLEFRTANSQQILTSQ